MTSNFQDGGHNAAGCPLARRARVTSLSRCMCYISRLLVYGTL